MQDRLQRTNRMLASKNADIEYGIPEKRRLRAQAERELASSDDEADFLPKREPVSEVKPSQ